MTKITGKQKDQNRIARKMEKINGMAADHPRLQSEQKFLVRLQNKAKVKALMIPQWKAQLAKEQELSKSTQTVKPVRHNSEIKECDSETDEENDGSVSHGVTVPASDDEDDIPARFLCHCGCGLYYKKMTYCNAELNQTGKGEKLGCRIHVSFDCRKCDRQCSGCAVVEASNEASPVVVEYRSKSRDRQPEGSRSYSSGGSRQEGERSHQEYRGSGSERCGDRPHQAWRGRSEVGWQKSESRSRSRSRDRPSEGSRSYSSGGRRQEGERSQTMWSYELQATKFQGEKM